MIYQRSSQLFAEAEKVIPGGVNSPVRAFKGVGGTPLFAKSAKGAYLYDEDDNRLIDYINSWGPMILGHAYQPVVDAVIEKAKKGTSFGMPTELETKIAELAIAMVPNIDKIRFVNSGTEACMSAIRLARGYTKKDKIIKFSGCYHGHSDSFLIAAGSGLSTFGVPNSPGVTQGTAKDTLLAHYNDIENVKALFEANPNEIAAVIIEPVAGNMGCVPPKEGFLQALKEVCHNHNALLIFDEVMTGFRVGPQGVQGVYGITPDLTTLGKIIGGGMPMGAFGGRKDIMACIAPLGPVYQAGTLSGNPVAVAAGLTTMCLLKQEGFYEKLETQTRKLVEAFNQVAYAHGETFCADSIGGMFGIYFSEKVPSSFAEVSASNRDRFNKFFHAMLDAGVYLAPSAYEAGFVSVTHDDAVIDATKVAIDKAFAAIK